MRKGWRSAVFIMLVALLPLCVFAHPGDTDSRGGHTDSSTGKYHYHHGYPAHDHWDMDGDGDIDCPYLFDDKTGQNSGASGSGSGNGDSSSTDMYKNGYEKGYNDGYDDGYEDGHEEGHDSGYAQAEADLSEKHQKEVRSSGISAGVVTAICVVIFVLPPVTGVAVSRAEKRAGEEKEQLTKAIVNLKARYEEEIHSLCEKNRQENNKAVLGRLESSSEDPIDVPEGITLEIRCVPIKGKATASRPFGDYTVYTSAGGKKYHCKQGCSGATKPVHFFELPSGLSPCANCVTRDMYPQPLPEWYCQITGCRQDPEKSPSTQGEGRCSLKSSVISSAEYNKGVIYMTFVDGGSYAYYNVPKDVYDGLIKAQSPGKYFHEKINGVYPYAPYHE